MIIDAPNLSLLFEGFKTTFNKGFEGAQSVYDRIAMTVPSNTSQEQYGWMKQIPDIREWIGPRAVHNLAVAGFTIANRNFELTISVDRDSIMDDQFGVFGPLFSDMGRRTKEHPDRLVFELVANGFTASCFDGQPFFDTDHPVKQADETDASVSNVQAGASEPWYLFDTTKALKPFVYQLRKPFDFVRKDRPEDDNVFNNREFIYGVDGRSNVGFGLWQLAFGSKAPLGATHYKAARAAMMGMVGDYDRKLGVNPNLLICGPGNEEAARKLLNSEYGDGGESNPWKGSADLLVTPWVG